MQYGELKLIHFDVQQAHNLTQRTATAKNPVAHPGWASHPHYTHFVINKLST